MKTASDNSHLRIIPHDVVKWCERCKREKPLDMAVAFQGDGTATFRFLCAKCERAERHINQPSLYAESIHAIDEEAIRVCELLEIRIRHHENMAAAGANHSAIYVIELKEKLLNARRKYGIESEEVEEIEQEPEIESPQLSLFGGAFTF